MVEQNAVEIREVSESELADFDKMVELVLREHSEVEALRNRSFMHAAALSTAVIGFGSVLKVFADEPDVLTIAAIAIFAAGTLGIWFGHVRATLQRRRRTYEELAEIVREAAPMFMPKMSFIRRAEIQIRLWNIGIYDPLKHR